MVLNIFRSPKKEAQKILNKYYHHQPVALLRSLTMNRNDNKETLRSHPCNKPCVYCKLLTKTENPIMLRGYQQDNHTK